LLKFEILEKKNGFIKNNIKEINERNAKIRKTTAEIDDMLETLSTQSSQLGEASTTTVVTYLLS
jgi:F0F1-type ATP synthase membrane subunit b/b'